MSIFYVNVGDKQWFIIDFRRPRKPHGSPHEDVKAYNARGQQ